MPVTSDTFCKLSTLGLLVFHPRIVALPNSHFFSSAAMNVLFSLHHFVNTLKSILNLLSVCGIIFQKEGYKMFKSYKDLCNFTRILFMQIENTDNISSIEIKGYSRNEIDEFLYQCVKAEYILNIEAYKDANSTPHFDKLGKPYVSIAGYQFLNDLRSDIALEKSRNADIKGWIAVVVSILTFCIYVLEQIDVIRPFIEKVTQLLK